MAVFFPENFSQELKALPNWALWKKEIVSSKLKKVPYQVSGKKAKSNNPSTWCKFNTALTAYQDVGGYDGICFMMPVRPTKIIFIDIDDCIKDGIIEPWALEIVKRFDSYTERSQSGEGLHILIKGIKPIRRCRKAGSPFEIYDCLRPCYLTGETIEAHTTINARQEALNRLYEDIFADEMRQAREPQRKATPGSTCLPDEVLIQKALQAKNGQEFKALWEGSTIGYGGDESAADMALVNMLAFWTGGDVAQMERIFSQSGLGKRAKWTDRQDYRDRTIAKAISDAREFYVPLCTVEEGVPIRELPLTRERCDMIEAETGVHIYNAIDDNSISEEDIKALPRAENPRLEIMLEPDNFIMIYTAYGAKTCDAYPEYHYTSSISLLAICTNRNLVLRLSQDDLYPNIWVMNLGKSTVSRKSAAIGKFSRFAGDLFPLAALPQSYSPEGLLEELTEKPKGYLVKDEAAAMIEAMEKNYMLEMRDIYCILYDCKGYRRKLRTSQRNKQSEFGAMDPFINLLCATTPESFSQFTTLNDLTSGWLVRFIYTLPNYKKPYMHFKPISEEDQNAYAEVLSRLAYIKGLLYNRESPIEIQLEPDAWAYYQAWQEQREGELVETGDDIQLAFFGRLAFTALKLAILFTIGRADYTEETNVSLAHVQEACRQVDAYFIPIGRIIADIIAMDEANNLQEKVLATLGRNGGRLKWTSLMRLIHQDRDKLEKAVAALVESEEVKDIFIQSAGHKSTRWILLKDKNKTGHSELKPIRYAETKSSKGSKSSNVSKSSKVSTDSCDPPGIQANNATIATFAKDATFGKVVEEDDHLSSGPHPRKDEPTPATKIKADVARKHTEKVCSYSDMVQFVPYDTSSPEAEKICAAIRGQLARGIAPRIDFVRIDTKLSGEIVQTYMDNAQWLTKDESAPSGIVVYLPNVP